MCTTASRRSRTSYIRLLVRVYRVVSCLLLRGEFRHVGMRSSARDPIVIHTWLQPQVRDQDTWPRCRGRDAGTGVKSSQGDLDVATVLQSGDLAI